jgi:hypothetical protein
MSEFEDFKLPTDQYYIRNEQQFAGRNAIEDKSLLPKAVHCPNDRRDAELVSTPKCSNIANVTLTFSQLLQWVIERLPNGRYKLTTRGAPTGVVKNLLFAFLIERAQAEEWIITKRKQEGPRSLFT